MENCKSAMTLMSGAQKRSADGRRFGPARTAPIAGAFRTHITQQVDRFLIRADRLPPHLRDPVRLERRTDGLVRDRVRQDMTHMRCKSLGVQPQHPFGPWSGFHVRPQFRLNRISGLGRLSRKILIGAACTCPKSFLIVSSRGRMTVALSTSLSINAWVTFHCARTRQYLPCKGHDHGAVVCLS